MRVCAQSSSPNSRFPPSLQNAHIPKETERGPHDGRWEGHRGNTESAAPRLALRQRSLFEVHLDPHRGLAPPAGGGRRSSKLADFGQNRGSCFKFSFGGNIFGKGSFAKWLRGSSWPPFLLCSNIVQHVIYTTKKFDIVWFGS